MEFIINSGRLKKALRVVAGFRSKDATKEILRYVNVKLTNANTGEICLYATNAFKLIKYELSGVMFEDFTEFKIDPYFILKIMKLYNIGDYQDVKFHSEDNFNILMDVDVMKNIPLPITTKTPYPSLENIINKETTDLNIFVDVNEMLDIMKQIKKSGIETVKLMTKGNNNNMIKFANDAVGEIEILLCTKRGF